MKEKTISRETLFIGRAINLHIDTVEMPDGRRTTREVVEHEPVIVVVPVDDHGKIILIRQYRQPIDKELLEIPAGGIEPGESPEEAVIRELREEIGFRPQFVKKLGGFYAIPGYGTEYLHLFLAANLVRDPLKAEDTDIITLVPTELAAIKELIKNGELCDSKSIAGLMIYLEMVKNQD